MSIFVPTPRAARKPSWVAVTNKFGVVLSVASALTFSTIAPANAFFFLLDPNLQDDIEHFIECKQLIFSDPELHAETCLPSRVELPFGSINTLQDSDADEAPPAPAPPPSDPEHEIPQ